MHIPINQKHFLRIYVLFYSSSLKRPYNELFELKR